MSKGKETFVWCWSVSVDSDQDQATASSRKASRSHHLLGIVVERRGVVVGVESILFVVQSAHDEGGDCESGREEGKGSRGEKVEDKGKQGDQPKEKGLLTGFPAFDARSARRTSSSRHRFNDFLSFSLAGSIRRCHWDR